MIYDLLVLGGGSAGFNAARLAHSLGKRVAIVDGARQLGGLCILRGCMPSKTLLYMAEVLHLARKGKAFGLKIPSASADMKAMHARKNRIIREFASYREAQLKSGRWDLFRSRASFVDARTVQLEDSRRLSAKNILIATGSRVSVPPIPGLSETPCLTSDEVLDLDRAPASVIVLGGGIVACELAQFLSRVGSRVTLIQRSAHILRDHSPEAGEVLQQAFRDEGIEVFTGTKLEKISGREGRVSVRFFHRGRPVVRRAACLFNALGREPDTTGLRLERAGVKTGHGGRVLTNRFQETNIPGIFAAGDVSGPYDVVHLAIAQGELAVRRAFGVKGAKPIDDRLVLNVVFTDPQLATIGFLEKDLVAAGKPFVSAHYPFNDHGKSILMEANYGYVKVLAEPRRGRLLGAEIVGKDAGELIHCFSGPLSMRATAAELLKAPWYHPTLAEIITYPLEEIAETIASAQKH